MQHYDIVLFDLDGTLTDPGLGITNAVAHALRRFNIPVPPRPELYKFIGPPLVDSFMEYYGMTKEQADTAVIYYREHYRDTGLFENVVYDGIDAMLTHLTAAGKMPVLATSKPEVFARRILEHFNLDRYFPFVAGATLDGSLSTKGDVIARALTLCHPVELCRVVMVGDRKHDIFGAK